MSNESTRQKWVLCIIMVALCLFLLIGSHLVWLNKSIIWPQYKEEEEPQIKNSPWVTWLSHLFPPFLVPCHQNKYYFVFFLKNFLIHWNKPLTTWPVQEPHPNAWLNLINPPKDELYGVTPKPSGIDPCCGGECVVWSVWFIGYSLPNVCYIIIMIPKGDEILR